MFEALIQAPAARQALRDRNVTSGARVQADANGVVPGVDGGALPAIARGHCPWKAVLPKNSI